MDTTRFIVIRHRKENLKKCSLRGLETRPDFLFFTYPECLTKGKMRDLQDCFLLDIDGDELSSADQGPCIILDGTWRYALVMRRQITQLQECRRRRLPNAWKTAYPRCQTECSDPERGLASIEAIYAASVLTGQSTEGLLDLYYWKDSFLEKNRALIASDKKSIVDPPC
jgi:pre-rRNA-processing protein TSR3